MKTWIIGLLAGLCASLTACTYRTYETAAEADSDDMGTGTTLGTKFGWGTSGKLKTGDTIGQVTTQAVFPETGSYTIQLDKTDNSDTNNPIAAQALVTWSVEGNYVTRRLNVGNGAALTGTAQAVRVAIVDATADAFGVPNGVEYSVAVQITPGVRGTSKQPPTLVPQYGFDAMGNRLPPNPLGLPITYGGNGTFVILPATTIGVPIPRDSGTIAIYVTAFNLTTFAAPTPGDITITVSDPSGATIQLFDPSIHLDWVPLTPGASDVTILNNSKTDTYSITVVYGIEG